MKIVILGLGRQEDICDAFNEIADVVYWDITKAQGSFNHVAKQLVDAHEPDLMFMQIQTPGIISIDTAKYLSERTKTINWTGDVRLTTPQWMIDVGRFMHLTLFSNMHDVEFIRKFGIKADYLQIGVPDKIFTPHGKAKENAPEIIFMGNNVGHFPLSKMRADMVKALAIRYGNRFGYYGINWGKGIDYVPDQHEEASYYRGAKIGINLSHFNYSRYTSDRMLRIMGAGCMCLSHDYKDYNMEFEKGKHFDTWKDFTELFDRIDYYLEHEDERRKIAEQGCAHVHANHTWRNRVEQLMKMI